MTSSEARRVISKLASVDCANMIMPAADIASTFSGIMRPNSA